MNWFRTIASVVVAGCLLPFASLIVALGVAALGSCPLDEGSVHPCVLSGRDWGPTLYTMSVGGWLGLIALPLLAGTAAVWLVVEVVHRLQKRDRL